MRYLFSYLIFFFTYFFSLDLYQKEWQGFGTPESPYIIGADGIFIAGIEISNIYNVHFKIVDSLIHKGYEASDDYGIRLFVVNSVDVEISGNIVAWNSRGIFFSSVDGILIDNNHILDSHYQGIWSIQSHLNVISGNTIMRTVFYGMMFSNSDSNTISGNLISDSRECGIHMYSDDNLILNNEFNNIRGIYLSIAAMDNVIVMNSFYKRSGYQAWDLGTNNDFTLNFFDDWKSPDNQAPIGIVDSPYIFEGGRDDLPRVSPDVIYDYHLTPDGPSVQVTDEHTGITLVFDEVETSGVTTIIETPSCPKTEPSFRISSDPPICYSITTTVDFDGVVTLIIPYNPPEPWTNTYISHWNEVTGTWENLETQYIPSRGVLVATTPRFSIFAILEELDLNTPQTTISADPFYQDSIDFFTISTSEFTLEADDDYSGIDYIEYKIDDGVWIIYSTPFILPGKGQHIIYFRSIDLAGNVEDTRSLIITVDASKITYDGDLEGVYSDVISLNATLVDIVTLEPLVGQPIEFTLGTQSIPVVTDGNGFAEATKILDQSAGLKELSVTFAGNNDYLFDLVLLDFISQKETATSSYTGTTIATTFADEISLRATVLDEDDGYWGDLSHATVSFYFYTAPIDSNSPLQIISGVPVVPTTSSGVGVATIGTSNIAKGIYVVYIQFDDGINDYYTGDWSDAVVLTIYEPTGEFVTGGGWINDPSGGKGNFGFNVKYLKNGRVQGHSIYIYREDDWEIIVKSNKWNGMAIEEEHAFFEGKCVVQMFNSKTGELIWDEGNYQFRVDVWDYEEGPDIYQIRVYDKEGLVFHEAGFNPLGELQGGNITIHQDKK